jgi:hypothetical protein
MAQIIVSLSYPRVISTYSCKLLERKFASDFLNAALEKVAAPLAEEISAGVYEGEVISLCLINFFCGLSYDALSICSVCRRMAV